MEVAPEVTLTPHRVVAWVASATDVVAQLGRVDWGTHYDIETSFCALLDNTLSIAVKCDDNAVVALLCHLVEVFYSLPLNEVERSLLVVDVKSAIDDRELAYTYV